MATNEVFLSGLWKAETCIPACVRERDMFLFCDWHQEEGYMNDGVREGVGLGGTCGADPSLRPPFFLWEVNWLGQWKQEVGPSVWLEHTAANIRLLNTHMHTHTNNVQPQSRPRFLRSAKRTPLYYSPQGNGVRQGAGLSSSSLQSERGLRRGNRNQAAVDMEPQRREQRHNHRQVHNQCKQQHWTLFETGKVEGHECKHTAAVFTGPSAE